MSAMRRIPLKALAVVAVCTSCAERPEAGSERTLAFETVVEADTGFYQELSWSPDGSQLLVSVLEFERGLENYTYRIYRIDLEGKGVSKLTDGPLDYWTSWSPDGTRIAFSSRSDGNHDIYLMDADGTNRTRLSDDPAGDTHPAWSSDGSKIAFVSNREGEAEIYVMNADGSDPRRIGDSENEPGNPVWSPDGGRIVYYETDTAGPDYVYVMYADGSGRKRLAAGVWPAWSPDGYRIIYGGEGGLNVMNGDGTGKTLLVGGDVGFGRFSPDGSRVAYIAMDAGYVEICVMRLDGTERVKLLRRPAPSW